MTLLQHLVANNMPLNKDLHCKTIWILEVHLWHTCLSDIWKTKYPESFQMRGSRSSTFFDVHRSLHHSTPCGDYQKSYKCSSDKIAKEGGFAHDCYAQRLPFPNGNCAPRKKKSEKGMIAHVSTNSVLKLVYSSLDIVHGLIYRIRTCKVCR